MGEASGTGEGDRQAGEAITRGKATGEWDGRVGEAREIGKWQRRGDGRAGEARGTGERESGRGAGDETMREERRTGDRNI